MKFKICVVAVTSMLIYACSSSKPATKPVEETTVVVAEPAKPVLTEELQKGKTSYENNCARCLNCMIQSNLPLKNGRQLFCECRRKHVLTMLKEN